MRMLVFSEINNPDLCVFVCTFIEAYLVSQYDHAFSEQLVLKVLSEEGAQLRLQQLPAKDTSADECKGRHTTHTVSNTSKTN